MQYIFSKVQENLPKTANRSKRILKKLHLQEFGVVLVSICINDSVFCSPYSFQLLDVMYEHDDGICVTGDQENTHILVEIPINDFSIDYVKEYCTKLLFDLSNIDMEFAKIESIDVQYGDAYYGEW